MQDLRFPIEEFVQSGPLTAAERSQPISAIEMAPLQLEKMVEGLTNGQLEEPYRPGGSSIRQVVHHLPDRHMNRCFRLRPAAYYDWHGRHPIAHIESLRQRRGR